MISFDINSDIVKKKIELNIQSQEFDGIPILPNKTLKLELGKFPFMVLKRI